METVDKKKHKKPKNKSKPLTKEKVLIVAQELKFARLLAGNEKKSRDRVLKALKKWLGNCFEKGYDFKEDDFIRVWKGLFYAVWMSDKPLVQEELCDNISSTLDLFPADHYRHALLMMKAGYRVLATEWYGIDQHRFDKFLMLARRYLRGCLRAVSRQGWSRRSCIMFADVLASEDGILCSVTPYYARNALSLILHILDCYLEEIYKTAPSTLPPGSYAALLRPLLTLVARGEAGMEVAAGRALRRLIETTDLGIEYETRRRLWQQMGCPEGGPDALVPASDDEDNAQEVMKQDDEDDDDGNDDDRPLDPRAGRVDVVLRPISTTTVTKAASDVSETLRTLLRECPSKRHRQVKLWAERFEALARKEYPLKVSTVGLYQTDDDGDDDQSPRTTSTTDAAKRLRRVEREMIDKEQLALRGLSRKHRKRLLAQSRAGVSIAAELAALTGRLTTRPSVPNGNWQVEDAPSGTSPSDTCDNKDNTHRHKRAHELTQGCDTDTPTKIPRVEEQIHRPTVKRGLLKITVKDKRAEKKCNDKVNNKEKVKIIITQSPKKEKKLEKKVVKAQSPQKTQNMQSKQSKNKQKEIKVQEKPKKALLVVNKVKSFQKQTTSPKNDKRGNDKKKGSDKKSKIADKSIDKNVSLNTPKKVKFVLKNNSMQGTMDYYKSIRQSPNIPYDSSKKPIKTNLKPNSTPSPINPFFKKKLRSKLK